MSVTIERWPVAGAFTIARSSLTEIVVVVVELVGTREGRTIIGRGECRPYSRYGETPESVVARIEAHREALECADDLLDLCTALPPGAASNAIESAVVDLHSAKLVQPSWMWMNVPEPGPRVTAFTLSVAAPEAMAEAAREAARYPLLKVKIGGDDPVAQLRAVITARPDARFIVDANESLDADGLVAIVDAGAGADIVMFEQPLHAAEF